MKLNEVIELNGKEYTVELNRESIMRINQYVNIENTARKFEEQPLEDKTDMEIEDNENPFAEEIDEEKVAEQQDEKERLIRKAVTRAFWIWLYPVEKLGIKEVEKLLEPYFNGTEEEANYVVQKYFDYCNKSVEIRTNYLEELKNLKAQAK